MTTVVVIAGGPSPSSNVRALVPDADAVVAADSGVDHARALGLVPTVVVGDLDSISADALAWADSVDASMQVHPADKDETDLDLAMSVAARMADRVVVIDSGLGRIDHAAANLLLLASDRFAGIEVVAFVGTGLVTVVRGVRHLSAEPGDVVSLLACGGRASGVTTAGLRWPLTDDVLEAGSTRGVSNEFEVAEAEVTVREGVVLALQPVARSLP